MVATEGERKREYEDGKSRDEPTKINANPSFTAIYTVKKRQARGANAMRRGKKKISANIENQVTLDILVKSAVQFAFLNCSNRAY